VAFAIGRAIGPAVVRNQARRRLRALLQADASWPPGWYLIGARPAITERSFDAIQRDLRSLRTSIEQAARRPASGALASAVPTDPVGSSD